MKTKACLFSYIIIIFHFYLIVISAANAANKIMPLGDSITQGNSSGVADEEFQVSYRKALYDRLKAAGYVINNEIFVGSLMSGEAVADFDPDHEGHPGFHADEIVLGKGDPQVGTLADWLASEQPNIVLLHVGTNDITFEGGDETEIEDILVVIDDYEFASGNAVWVVLALIIDRSCDPFLTNCPNSLETTTFNNNVRDFVFFPRQAGGDKIVLVDMQNEADINYNRWDMGGDMWDDLHPFETGYTKMADLWFNGLMNILPWADAGPDQDVNEFDSVTLDGSASFDPKSGSLTYQWAQTSGPGVVLSDPQAVQPTFTAPDIPFGTATLTFTLAVIDDDQLVSTDTVAIVVAKIAPQANAGPDQAVSESAIVTLDASASVGVGLVYRWTQTAGTPVVLSGNQDVQPFFTAPDFGPGEEILAFELTVTDEDNVTSTDTVNITVICDLPSPPESINYPSNDSDSSFIVNWSAVSNATSYTLQRANNSSFSGAITVYSGSSTSYNQMGLSTDTYYYRVRANSSCGSSGWRTGDAINITVICDLPSPPESINYPSNDSDSSFIVNWSAVSNATSYTLQRANNSSFSGAITVYSGSSTSYNQMGLSTDTYYYRVRANSSCGSSGWRTGDAINITAIGGSEVTNLQPQQPSSNGGGSGAGCFIGTAVNSLKW